MNGDAKPETPNAKLRPAAYAAEQGIAEEVALKKGMEEKSKEFVEKGAEVLREGVNLLTRS